MKQSRISPQLAQSAMKWWNSLPQSAQDIYKKEHGIEKFDTVISISHFCLQQFPTTFKYNANNDVIKAYFYLRGKEGMIPAEAWALACALHHRDVL